MMKHTHFPWLDFVNGVGLIAIAIMAVFYLAFFASIEPLGPFAAFFLLAVGGVLAYGSYRVFSRT